MNRRIRWFCIGLNGILIAAVFSLACFSEEAIPRDEHPRPDLRRDTWLSLNGEWDFTIDPNNDGGQEDWHIPGNKVWGQKILVPYPWESKLSGVNRPDYNGYAWYHRRFSVPAEWEGKNIFLRFGAVDWRTWIWLDGVLIAEHEGGYTPFSVNLTDLLSGKEEYSLTVKVQDVTSPEQLVGKQVGWYTTTSGIWQTVYLEACGKKEYPFIGQLKIDTCCDGQVKISAVPTRATPVCQLRVLPDRGTDKVGFSETIDKLAPFTLHSPYSGELTISNPQLWTPESPSLYFVEVQMVTGEEVIDSVHTYFGVREVTREKYGENPYEYIYLNGKPYYFLCALNQAFHPDGIYTYPSDDAIRRDLEDTKEFGFNSLRVHIKVDEPRFYYWADRLGVAIFYDMPCFRKYTDRSKHYYLNTINEAIERDRNHPSIVSWVLFNETWGLEEHKTPEGQAWVKEMYEHAKQLDPTRLIEDNSPCRYDHVITDVNSWHFYIYPHQKAREHIEKVVNETYPGSTFNYIGGV